MTDTRRTPPRSAPAQHRRPFTHDPGQWEAERPRVLHTRHVRDTACTTGCEPVLVHEHPWWGWLAWTVPGDATLPDRPRHVGLALGATRLQRLSLRWLTRRPARRTALASAVPDSLRLTAAVLALIGLVTGLFAIAHGVRVGVARNGRDRELAGEAAAGGPGQEVADRVGAGVARVQPSVEVVLPKSAQVGFAAAAASQAPISGASPMTKNSNARTGQSWRACPDCRTAEMSG